MKELPFDITRCLPKQCDKKKQCARYTSEWNVYQQSVSDFSEDLMASDDCEAFINNWSET